MNYQKLLLILIIFISFLLRFYRVSEVPPSLNWDEVSIGYNAYSILKTGRDEWGELLPLHFKSYGEYKLPVQIYGSIPGIAIFGLNELGVRVTPVLYGTLTVLVVFFLTKELFGNSIIAMLAAFFLSISPWHLQLTRASFESSFACFWISLGVLFLVKGFKRREYLFFSVIFMAVAVYTYNTARVFVPPFLLLISLIYFKDFKRDIKKVLLAVVVFLILMTPIIPFIMSGDVKARYRLVSVTDDPGLVPRINENRGNSNLPDPFTSLIHNKVTYVSFYFLKNYLAHFSPDFLFISGAPHKQHHVQGIGELYIFQAPLLFLGLFYLFKRKEKFRWVLILWMVLTYIPIALTIDSIPHALRSAIAIPTYQIISALGGYYLWTLISKFRKIRFALVLMLVFLFVVQFFNYLQNYYEKYPYLYSRDWQYGYKQIVNYIYDNQDRYDLVVFSRTYGEPHMFTLFYERYDPYKFQNDPNLVRFETFNWVRVLKFDKYYFPDLGDVGTKYEDIVREDPGKKILFIGKKGDFPSDVPRLINIDFLDGTRAFEVAER